MHPLYKHIIRVIEAPFLQAYEHLSIKEDRTVSCPDNDFIAGSYSTIGDTLQLVQGSTPTLEAPLRAYYCVDVEHQSSFPMLRVGEKIVSSEDCILAKLNGTYNVGETVSIVGILHAGEEYVATESFKMAILGTARSLSLQLTFGTEAIEDIRYVGLLVDKDDKTSVSRRIPSEIHVIDETKPKSNDNALVYFTIGTEDTFWNEGTKLIWEIFRENQKSYWVSVGAAFKVMETSIDAVSDEGARIGNVQYAGQGFDVEFNNLIHMHKQGPVSCGTDCSCDVQMVGSTESFVTAGSSVWTIIQKIKQFFGELKEAISQLHTSTTTDITDAKESILKKVDDATDVIYKETGHDESGKSIHSKIDELTAKYDKKEYKSAYAILLQLLQEDIDIPTFIGTDSAIWMRTGNMLTIPSGKASEWVTMFADGTSQFAYGIPTDSPETLFDETGKPIDDGTVTTEIYDRVAKNTDVQNAVVNIIRALPKDYAKDLDVKSIGTDTQSIVRSVGTDAQTKTIHQKLDGISRNVTDKCAIQGGNAAATNTAIYEDVHRIADIVDANFDGYAYTLQQIIGIEN